MQYSAEEKKSKSKMRIRIRKMIRSKSRIAKEVCCDMIASCGTGVGLGDVTRTLKGLSVADNHEVPLLAVVRRRNDGSDRS
jgi:hypothetical protein